MSATLTTSPTFDADVLDELARHGDTRNWEAGATVVKEGDPADSIYIVHEGELRVLVSGEDGRAVELNTQGPGEVFGEMMLHGSVRSATVQTITRARLTCVTRAHVERLLKHRPDLAIMLLQRLIERVRTLTRSVRNLSSMDVYQRVVGLFEVTAVTHQGRQCVLGMSQQRIAERVGASRAMVNRLLHDLASGGYLEQERGCIVLLRKLPPRW
jgi:CRP/FNR family cyclic AMP-dependent transcriptional regulator